MAKAPKAPTDKKGVFEKLGAAETGLKKLQAGIVNTAKAVFKIVKYSAISAIALFGVTKNTPDATAARNVLEQQGYSDIQTRYAGIFSGEMSCTQKPFSSLKSVFTQNYTPTAFSAKNRDGNRVEGIVCFNAGDKLGREEAVVTSYSAPEVKSTTGETLKLRNPF